ncbi:hypothetical protein LNK15_10670 [Jeotgalicoccus huakuii]|uniref:hypothetical protein n=1 Tax=Jeotgalicoccus TaxID=227979 RepID=UPI000420F521|nr:MULTISPECIES: hypothetical protein [Jeotgalicoccus]MCK1977519.1 hypothetical protein [Jeotgalicoccus huakuii]QQD84512.1 hypothetical protein JEM45_07700 [Jeotgalicoccus sp. ATCC 8456]
MLSKEAEKFLTEFRLEMMAHGKKDEAIDDMEAELEDHLIQAEKDGKSLEDVTGRSAKEYIKNISGEMPRINNIQKYIALFIVYLAGILTVPNLISGDFDWTLSNLLYYLGIIVLGPVLIYYGFKYILVNYASFKSEKIEVKGTVLIFVFSFLYMGLLVGSIFLVRSYPIVTFFEPGRDINITIGFILLAILVIGSLLMKQWFYAILALVLAAPEMIAQVFASGGPNSESYIIISSVGLLAAVIILFIGIRVMNRAKK